VSGAAGEGAQSRTLCAASGARQERLAAPPAPARAHAHHLLPRPASPRPLRYRPHPLKVVFGEPIVPQAGDTAETLHAKYVAGLLALAKQHGVPLVIAE
jgi:hypothetical protein